MEPHEGFLNSSKPDILTVNSPVTASKPTWMVCSKSDGGEISGLSFSFFLLAKKILRKKNHTFKFRKEDLQDPSISV